MKKFAAIFTSMLLAMSMAVSSVASAATADQTKIDFTKATTLTLTKTDDPDVGLDDENPVKDAIFTAYKVLDLVEGGSDYGTYVLADEDLANVVVRDNVTLADDLKQQTGSDASEGGLYTSTDDLESAIPQIVKLVNDGKLDGTVAPATDAQGKTTFGTLDLGVYLVIETVVPNGYIVSSDPFLVTLPQWDNNDGWQYDVEAFPKDQPMTIDKEANGYDNNNYEIGQKVEFTVNADIPNYGYTNESVNANAKDGSALVKVTEATTDDAFNKLIYNFEDKATDGITFLTDGTGLKDLKVEVVDVNAQTGEETLVATLAQAASKDAWKKRANGTITGTGDYVVNAAADSFTLDLAWAAIDQYQMNDTYQIKLTYYAQINEKAIDNSDINEISLTYDKDPNNNPPIPDYDTIRDEVELYSYELDLTKKFDGQAATDASAVTFQLYRGKNNTDAANRVNFVANGEGNYIVWNEKMEGNPATVTDINCAANGGLVIDGLDAYNAEDANGFDGYYTLLEVNTKDGYAVPATPFTIRVVANKDADGKLIPGIENATNFVYDGRDAKESNLTLAEAGKIETAEVVKANNAQEVVISETDAVTTFEMTVNNVKKQFNLPLTGGLGLWMFTIAGGVVMAGVIIFFSAIRKKESK